MGQLSLVSIAFVLFLPARSVAQPSSRVKQPHEFFNHPEALCSALKVNGIQTGPWKQLGSGFFDSEIEPSAHAPYACEYPARVAHSSVGVPTTHTSGPETTLIFRISGDAQRADLISIAVTVHQLSALATGKEELHRHIVQLFKVIDHREPAELYRSIESQRYFLSRQSYGIVWFNLVKPDHHKINDQTLWFRLQQ